MNTDIQRLQAALADPVYLIEVAVTAAVKP